MLDTSNSLSRFWSKALLLLLFYFYFFLVLIFLELSLQLRAMVLPDRYIDHGSPQDQIEEVGLSARNISATILSLLGRPKEALQLKWRMEWSSCLESCKNFQTPRSLSERERERERELKVIEIIRRNDFRSLGGGACENPTQWNSFRS